MLRDDNLEALLANLISPEVTEKVDSIAIHTIDAAKILDEVEDPSRVAKLYRESGEIFFAATQRIESRLGVSVITEEDFNLEVISQQDWMEFFYQIPVLHSLDEYISLCKLEMYSNKRDGRTKLFRIDNTYEGYTGSFAPSGQSILAIFSQPVNPYLYVQHTQLDANGRSKQPEQSAFDLVSLRTHRHMMIFLELIRQNIDAQIPITEWRSNVLLPRFSVTVTDSMKDVWEQMQRIPIRYTFNLVINPEDLTTHLSLPIVKTIFNAAAKLGISRRISANFPFPDMSSIVGDLGDLEKYNHTPRWQAGHVIVAKSEN